MCVRVCVCVLYLPGTDIYDMLLSEVTQASGPMAVLTEL